MDKRELAKAYIDDAISKLNLKQWTVIVSESLPPDDAYADVEASTNLWQATIRLSQDFWKEKPDSQRRIIAHELIHLHYAGVERLVEQLESSLGSIAFDIVSSIWDVESERGADALSFPLAELLPMPEFSEVEHGRQKARKRKSR
ncbi:hypothetical protein UFOVP1344_46 [uncultured Caudovirales phage]|uniref:Uncharacterized protein n=1 Tax=uncultured Caudovirales phage TaxID=2100421 RepID=A0A6J5QDB7_9CAUD|nr:hypothetical protein UFOVP1005_46 [uncultured Caudovirales phage]CAB4200449.1 hypothetical protein UFOVP1344_46 [uncultured Caudovirales phage]CAB4218634.1 hypothetical protein UFOVP1602_42 [uncultured Caudovirales phage]